MESLGPDIKLVLFDTSHLNQMARDWSSRRADERRRAEAFVTGIGSAGWKPVLTWHHLEEMIRHVDDAAVEGRLDFIRSLPNVASPKAMDGTGILGSVVDLLAAEAVAASKTPDGSVVAVRDRVTDTLFEHGSGASALAWLGPDWWSLRPHLQARETRAREIVAIARSKVTNERVSEPVMGLLRAKLRDPAEAVRHLTGIRDRLHADMASRKGKKISNSLEVAANFMEDLIVKARDLPAISSSEDLVRLIFGHDIGLDDILACPEATVENISDLAKHRARLRQVCRIAGLPYEETKRVAGQDRIPSSLIQREINRHRQPLLEHDGSELADSYLACFGPYVTACFVDKRTKENLRRALRHSADLRSLMNRVEGVGRYQDAAAIL